VPYHCVSTKHMEVFATLGRVPPSKPENQPGFSARELPGKNARKGTNAQQIIRRQSGLLGRQ
jgi:hypothetical protein